MILTPLMLFFTLFNIPNFKVFGEITDVRSVTPIIQNLMTVVSFLVGIVQFILGIYIQYFVKLTKIMNKYLKILMSALVFPSIFIIIYGIVLAEIIISLRNIHYLIILSNLKSQFLN
ncbi:MAG: hypothetical protein ACPKPY_03140 [Nitrososphaeraceae archaeon]